MSDERKFFFGYVPETKHGIEWASAIRLSGDLDVFKDVVVGDGVRVRELADRSFNGSLVDIGRWFFSSMMGFLDAMKTAGFSLDLIHGAEVGAHIRHEVGPHAIRSFEKAGWKVSEIDPAFHSRVIRKTRQMLRRVNHISDVSDLFLLGLVAKFDSYVGDLIRCVANEKPHIVLGSAKEFKAAEIFDFDSLDAFKEAVLEAEIEAVLRNGHDKQFEWLEKRLGLELRRDLKVWPDFIEICERRNLYAHAAGAVSQGYLEKCERVGHKNHYALGEIAEVTPGYLVSSCLVMIEIGVKLAQVLSRAIYKTPEADELCDQYLNESAYELICDGYYAPAVSLLSFGLGSSMKHPRKKYAHMMRINLANALKCGGDEEKARLELSKEDWAALRVDFQICAAAVLDDLDEFKRLLPLVPEDAIPPECFVDWPVFSGLMRNPDYVSLLRDRFGDQLISLSWDAEDAEV